MSYSLPPSLCNRSAASTVSDPASCWPASKVKLCCEVQIKLNSNVSFQEIIDATNCWLASSGLTVALGRHCPQRVGVPLLSRCCSSILIEPANLRAFSLHPTHSSSSSSSSSSSGGSSGSSSSSKDMQNCLSAAFTGSCKSSLERQPLVLPYCQVQISVLPYVLHEGVKEGGVEVSDDEESSQTAAAAAAEAAAAGPDAAAAAAAEAAAETSSLFKQWTLPNKEFDGIWDNLHFEEEVKETLLEYAATALLFSHRNVNSKASKNKKKNK
ncbi:thyroid hormone receptor interactor, putative [Eimeria brunetti]|uniref:Thyroid hormone receptor interactor, putative n=1 Tax=Eimeria brunetti TaxID=51314 RepID=U6LA16_9EIME|nr:thyroid hormone receptor interactor, putative [Eimeria brunetti]